MAYYDMLTTVQDASNFCSEFEDLYVQGKPERIDFVRQSIHSIWHMPTEVIRTGPAAYTSQWPLERTIGDLGQQIKQPSSPYANLSQRSYLQAQVNALQSVIPGLEQRSFNRYTLPHGAKDIGDSYALLRASDDQTRSIPDVEADALFRYLSDHAPAPGDRVTEVARWARLRLPNRQIVRSHWKESLRPANKLCRARFVAVSKLLT